MNNKAFEKNFYLVILFFLLINININFAQAPTKQQSEKKPASSIKERPSQVGNSTTDRSSDAKYKPKVIDNEEIIKAIAQDMTSQTEKISNIIFILSIIIGVIVISIPFLTWYFDRKQSQEINRSLEFHRSRIEFLERDVQRTIEGIESRLENQLLNELKEKMDINLRNQSREMKEQFNNYQSLLFERLDFNIEPMDERLLKAEIVRFSIWNLLLPRINRAIQGKKWMKYIEVWNNYHTLNLALAQVLSSRIEDICTGLGKFLDLNPQGIVPPSLWNLILLLKEQNRLEDLRALNMVQRLGKEMGRSLDEKSTEFDDSEEV